jgi:hypothetical protein
VWHVSIARLNPSGKGLISTDRWGGGTLRYARRIAMRALNGVGDGESVEMLKPVCLHLRRSLSLGEVGTLSSEWLAIPARDEFSEDGVIEQRL